MEKCSIIIASHNESENLKKCLDSIINTDYPAGDYEIILVDNNSTDNTHEIVSKFTQVIYLKEDRQGAAFARNKGIAAAKEDILVFLDADTMVERSWLTRITEPFGDETVGAVGGAIRPLNSKSMVSRYLGVSLFMRYPLYGKKRKIRGYPSCNLAVRRDLINGGFDTDTFTMYGGEDKDICYRIIEKGKKVIFHPGAVIYHRHPENIRELFRLFVKSSAGRAAFSRKYPSAPDILFLNLHIPLAYTALVIFALFFFSPRMFLVILSPVLIYLLYSSIISFMRSRDLLLSFIVKPALDIMSVFVIYVSYHYYKLVAPKKINDH